jgi:hypothetical protein
VRLQRCVRLDCFAALARTMVGGRAAAVLMVIKMFFHSLFAFNFNLNNSGRGLNPAGVLFLFLYEYIFRLNIYMPGLNFLSPNRVSSLVRVTVDYFSLPYSSLFSYSLNIYYYETESYKHLFEWRAARALPLPYSLFYKQLIQIFYHKFLQR